MSWQIAIDGPAGAGKSTIAKMLAKILGFEYIDTGAMYRAVTFKALSLNINMDKEEDYKFLEETKIDFINQNIYLDNIIINDKIRNLEISKNVSLVASYGYVRTKLVALQRQLADEKNIIMDGRDIGSKVLPNANLKIFLTASVEERAKRRMDERLEKGQEQQDLEDTIKEIKERDYKDSNRLINPLVVPIDAITIDSTDIDAKKVVEKIITLVLERGYKMENQNKNLTQEATKEVVKTPEDLLNQEVEVLNLPPLFTFTLREQGLVKIKDLINKTAEEIMQVPGIKAKRLATLTDALAVHNLTLKQGEDLDNKPKKSKKKVKEEIKMEDEVKVEKEEQQEAKAVVEEKPELELDNTEDEDVDDSIVEEESHEEETETKEAPKYRALQVVEGKVKEVLNAKEGFTKNNKVYKPKPERVLIELEDGQQGFLYKKDTSGIHEDEELFDLFAEGDNVQVVIKKIYPEGYFIFSTVLLKMRDELKKYNEIIKNNQTINAKVVKKLNTGYLLKDGEFSCLLPTPQLLDPSNDEDLVGKELEVAPIRIDYGRIRLIVSEKLANSIINRKEKKAFLESINVGDVFEGTVKNIESYGAFVEISDGVEGLLHISELEHYRVFKVDKILKPGDKVQVKIIKLENDHVGLSRKALIPNYWVEYTNDKKEGSVVTSVVTEINKAGVVVELAENVTGFLPRSEYSYERDANLNDNLKLGDKLELMIIEIDVHKKRIILSKKQLYGNPWETIQLKSGQFIEVEVLKELKDGFIVQYGEISGYLPKANIPNDKNISIGELIKVRVRLFEPNNTRLMVQVFQQQERVFEREVYGKFTKQTQEKLTSSFGDLLEQYKKKK